jgi:hypothetical protein
MGVNIFRCYLGFPTFRNTPAGEALEREGGRMEKAYRQGHSQMLRGFDLLHGAVDAALVGDPEAIAVQGGRGVRRLELATAAIADLATTLEKSRKALTELIAEGRDPLALREAYFGQVDAGRLGAELARRTGRLSDKSLWGEMAGALASGGAAAGLRLLERTAWRLQTALREQTLHMQRALEGEPRAVAGELHSSGLAGAVLADLWSTLFRQAGYLSLLCEEATRVWEVEVEREEAMTA